MVTFRLQHLFCKNKITAFFYYHLKIVVTVPLITGHLLVGFILFINAYLILILASKFEAELNFEFLIRYWQIVGVIFICYCLHRMLAHSHTCTYLWLRQNEPIQCIGTNAFSCKSNEIFSFTFISKSILFFNIFLLIFELLVKNINPAHILKLFNYSWVREKTQVYPFLTIVLQLINPSNPKQMSLHKRIHWIISKN